MHMKREALPIIGFIVSLVLTLLSYAIIMHPDFFHLKDQMAVEAILFLACIQGIVQFIFFLTVWREKAPFWNLHFFVSTLSIIAIIIFFTLWIMDTLNDNMMA